MVIRGETSHYDHVCEEAARGIQDVALRTGIPCGFGLLTVKPSMVIYNIGDEQSPPPSVDENDGVPRTALRGKLEMELAQMSPEDAKDFLKEYGIEEPGLNRIIRLSYDLLGLHSFLTAGEDEVRAATGVDDPRKGINRLRSLGPGVLILKRGGEGAILFDSDRVLEVPPVRMEVVNGLGAGDAFLAAFTHGVLRRIDLPTAVRQANWAGAHVASQIPCSEAMPFLKDLEAASAVRP